jgi:hypothetical protein
MTTCTVVPVTDSPDVGWTIVTTAGDAGLAPDACGAEALGSPGVVLPGAAVLVPPGVAVFGVEPEHAPAPIATATTKTIGVNRTLDMQNLIS